ncbi:MULTISPECIES: hypothetical protein [unclassified Bradyrhizobium]|uniref:hypothetical protein n=1 Tax=unclassified Bradyrhizobium TaxID=2631580 RepID=UPI001BAA4714|nr:MULTISPECIES: hypothetical protein [unclassified Bradyrhizobium]MBR1203975.1 hypothetical protein [Bradyrhizobium sp. AUGA SZCCT0124]MBR1310139.1 hypothetical protein [Bradyrhizobium sp. AUGA SZCCT0051]MBR1340280.1 hypothetical protein [Bradyrhizobium sp. AUGA SZCCT0105]MBR1354887.1 hypothetical protein [Bradyrhizobium sp. AUGA SZCCT0045]
MNDRAVQLMPGFGWPQTKLAMLAYAHVVVCAASLYFVTLVNSFPAVISFDQSHLTAAILNVVAFSPAVLLFAIGRFSFGYLVGFYFYIMVLGYLWLIEFSLLEYDHRLALTSIVLSALAFLAPALFITAPVRQAVVIPARTFHMMPSIILIASAAIIGIGSLYNLKLVDLTEMYKYRAEVALPAYLRYAVWIFSSALLPFAFACFVVSKRLLQAGVALLLMLLFYPIILTKMALFAPAWLLFLAVISKLVEARKATILSFFLPVLIGVVCALLYNAGLIPLRPAMVYFGIVNNRMIAIPSLALEIYNNYFSAHPLTHFCQINIVKLVAACPYDEPIWAIMAKVYELGAFNASLFATEGIASVGLVLAPVSALICGLIIALGNRLSSGLPPRFVLLSTGILPQVLLNVPLSTALLTNGVGLLFLLWYVSPRCAFEQAPKAAPADVDSLGQSAIG